jgi:hypothetical protein
MYFSIPFKAYVKIILIHIFWSVYRPNVFLKPEVRNATNLEYAQEAKLSRLFRDFNVGFGGNAHQKIWPHTNAEPEVPTRDSIPSTIQG